MQCSELAAPVFHSFCFCLLSLLFFLLFVRVCVCVCMSLFFFSPLFPTSVHVHCERVEKENRSQEIKKKNGKDVKIKGQSC